METSKERHPESRTQLTQLCNPTGVTVLNSRLKDTSGRQLEDHIIWEAAGSSETIGKRLRNHES